MTALVLILVGSAALAKRSSRPSATAPEPADIPAPRFEMSSAAPANGLTLVEVKVSGGRGPLENESSTLPSTPWVACKGAATFPARGVEPPKILAPARVDLGSLSCRVTLRRGSAAAKLELERPPPGLYLEISNPSPYSQDPPLDLRPFVVENGAARLAPEVRMRASSGAIGPGPKSPFQLTLPGDKAPRPVAIALTDGQRHGAAFIPAKGRTRLPVKADVKGRRKVQIEVRVGGRAFGPLSAPKRKVVMPIEVPVGVSVAAVRAWDTIGNITEATVDLRTPSWPRVAAIAATDGIAAGESTTLIVAVAAPDGRPAPTSTRLSVRAKRGKTGEPVRAAAGLWTIPYEAPALPGKDRVLVGVEGDAEAGKSAVALVITTGAPAAIEIKTPPEPLDPGAETTLPFSVSDRAGNVIPGVPVEARLGDETLAMGKDGSSVVVRAPQRLPDDLTLRVEMSAGDLEQTVTIPARAGPAKSATISFETGLRDARMICDIRDQYGNTVGPDTLDVKAQGARTEGLELKEGRLEGLLVADEASRSATVSVSQAERMLAEERVEFDPPPSAWRLGLTADVGFNYNLGVIKSPRASLGIVGRKGVGALQLGLRVGAGLVHQGDTKKYEVGDFRFKITRRVDLLSFPLLLTVRYPLSDMLAINAAAGPVMTYGIISSDPEFQPAEVATTTAVGWRARLAVDGQLGPGRVLVAITFGQTKLKNRLIRGEAEGLAVLIGYAWWLADLGG